MRSALAFVAFLFFLPLQAAPAPADQGFRVSIYTNVNTAPNSIRYDLLDGLVLAFVNPIDDCGNFASTTISGAKEIARRARTQNAKGHPIFVTFAIGGGGNDAANRRFEAIASSDTCRKKFAGQVAKILSANDLDGVNFDWEFPNATSLDNYTLLVQELRKAIGKKLLSIAIYNDAGKGKAMGLTQGVIPFVDYYMVMAYLSPRNAALDAWLKPPWNLPEYKLRLGWALFGDSVDGGSLGYNEVLTTVPANQASPCSDRVGKYVINGLRTTGELTRFAMTENLGGITGWELSDDRTDSISLLSDASEVSRMWEDFAEWRSGTTYPAGTVVQNQGNLWMVKAPSSRTEPSLKNPAYLQYEPLNEWTEQDYYCGGEQIWFDGTVYLAVQDPMLSVTDQCPTADPSLWKKLYSASLYDDSRAYEKGDRVFFNDSVYAANKTTQGVSPFQSLANWSPVVNADAFDMGASYLPGATVRYMGNEYRAVQSSKGLYPVVATDSWVPVTK